MKKWDGLAEKVKNEPMILGTRVTGESLKKVYQNGLAIKKEHAGQIIAFRGLWSVNGGNFMELGSFWVESEWRGHKLGSQVMEEIYSIFPPGKIIFAITKNPKVVHLLRKHNWQEATPETWEDVIPYEVSCGPCDWLPDEKKKNCPNKAQEGKCLMFFYQS